jgi:xylan 1,4-beta-xylosidase
VASIGRPEGIDRRLFLRIRNDRHIATMWYGTDGAAWTKYDHGMELSGYHHRAREPELAEREAGLFRLCS